MVDILNKEDYFDGFPIVVARREPQPPFPLHRHNFSELVIVTGGSGLHVIKDEEYPIAAGDTSVITDNSPHEYRNMKGLALINILYDARALGMARRDVRALPGYHALFRLEPHYRTQHRFESRLRLNMEDLASLQYLIDRLEKELAAREPGFRLLATALFMEMITFLSRCYGRAHGSTSRKLLRLGEAISYIEEHYRKDIDLDQLSAIAHMSRRTFTRTFRDAMGMSAVDHLIHLRIARAYDLLRSNDIMVTEAAFDVGFSDSNYFTRQFKRIIGQSPSEFRRTVLR